MMFIKLIEKDLDKYYELIGREKPDGTTCLLLNADQLNRNIPQFAIDFLEDLPQINEDQVKLLMAEEES